MWLLKWGTSVLPLGVALALSTTPAGANCYRVASERPDVR
jgi:hypothetical protein